MVDFDGLGLSEVLGRDRRKSGDMFISGAATEAEWSCVGGSTLGSTCHLVEAENWVGVELRRLLKGLGSCVQVNVSDSVSWHLPWHPHLYSCSIKME